MLSRGGGFFGDGDESESDGEPRGDSAADDAQRRHARAAAAAAARARAQARPHAAPLSSLLVQLSPVLLLLLFMLLQLLVRTSTGAFSLDKGPRFNVARKVSLDKSSSSSAVSAVQYFVERPDAPPVNEWHVLELVQQRLRGACMKELASKAPQHSQAPEACARFEELREAISAL